MYRGGYLYDEQGYLLQEEGFSYFDLLRDIDNIVSQVHIFFHSYLYLYFNAKLFICLFT